MIIKHCKLIDNILMLLWDIVRDTYLIENIIVIIVEQ